LVREEAVLPSGKVKYLTLSPNRRTTTMLYLGIDQHARQITISLRDDNGDVVQARQVSTQPDKGHAYPLLWPREPIVPRVLYTNGSGGRPWHPPGSFHSLKIVTPMRRNAPSA